MVMVGSGAGMLSAELEGASLDLDESPTRVLSARTTAALTTMVARMTILALVIVLAKRHTRPITKPFRSASALKALD